MKVKTLNISLPVELIEFIDVHAKLTFQTRSGYIRQVLVNQLRKQESLNKKLIDDPEKTYQMLRRERLKKYLASVEIGNEDIR